MNNALGAFFILTTIAFFILFLVSYFNKLNNSLPACNVASADHCKSFCTDPTVQSCESKFDTDLKSHYLTQSACNVAYPCPSSDPTLQTCETKFDAELKSHYLTQSACNVAYPCPACPTCTFSKTDCEAKYNTDLTADYVTQAKCSSQSFWPVYNSTTCSPYVTCPVTCDYPKTFKNSSAGGYPISVTVKSDLSFTVTWNTVSTTSSFNTSSLVSPQLYLDPDGSGWGYQFTLTLNSKTISPTQSIKFDAILYLEGGSSININVTLM